MTYDKLETKNVFSPHFGECRDGWIKLHHSDPDNTLLVGREARQYKVRVANICLFCLSAQLLLGCMLRYTGCLTP